MMMYFDRLHTKRITLDEALKDGPIFISSVCDCFTAMIAEDVGYKATCLAAEDFAAYYAGIPDIGLITPTELKAIEGQISKVSNIPMIIDMENGFGNEMNAIRAAVDLAEAGAMAVIMNDQVFPQHYGNEYGSRYLHKEEFVNKVRAVADALAGSDCVLIARVDSYADLGLDEAIARANAVCEVGAYMTQIKGVSKKEDIERIGREVNGRKMFAYSRNFKDRPASYDELVAMGYDIVLCPTFVDAAHCAYEGQLRQAYETKNDFFVNPVDSINGTERREFLGLNKWLEHGKKYNTEINVASKTKALD